MSTKNSNQIPVDYTGMKFGRLTVLAYHGKAPNGHRRGEPLFTTTWKCRCDCGKEVVRRRSDLVKGKSLSCGCLRRDKVIAFNQATKTTHGLTDSPEWLAWKHMHERCYKPSDPSYPSYGGRGISVCSRWQEFEQFHADMGPKPSPDHSIDRINNDGNYEPSNCRWATVKQQSNNRRNNHPITYNGETRNIIEWAEHLGIPYNNLRQRLCRGIPVEIAFRKKMSLP